MKEFEYKNLLQRKKMCLTELKKYYLEKRKYEFDNGIPLSNIELRKKIHFLPLAAIKLMRKIEKQKLNILQDRSNKTNKPVLFACTHIGGDDIQMAFEAIKQHAYLFLGDPEDLYQRIEGKLLNLNGVIEMETRPQESFIKELIDLKILNENEVEEFTQLIKNDRKIAYQRALELLKSRANLLIFPEGAWNITPNLPVMGIYNGTVRMAIETGAEIIPLAIEQYGKTFYVNIGENIQIIDRGPETLNYYNQKLRDTLATLKWEIWEYQGIKTKEECPTEEEFIEEIMSRTDYVYQKEDVYETMYKDKNIATQEEVFAPILKLNRVR